MHIYCVSDLGLPGRPMNVRYSDVNSTSFFVQWDEVDGADQYIVRWRNGSSSVREAVTSQTSHNITGLTPNTTYNVTITARNSCGLGTNNYTLSVTTLMMMSSFTTNPTGSRITLYTCTA